MPDPNLRAYGYDQPPYPPPIEFTGAAWFAGLPVAAIGVLLVYVSVGGLDFVTVEGQGVSPNDLAKVADLPILDIPFIFRTYSKFGRWIGLAGAGCGVLLTALWPKEGLRARVVVVVVAVMCGLALWRALAIYDFAQYVQELHVRPGLGGITGLVGYGMVTVGMWLRQAEATHFATHTRRVLAVVAAMTLLLVAWWLHDTDTPPSVSDAQVAALVHHDIVVPVAFAPDGTLASGSRDNTVRLWDTATQQETATIHSGRDEDPWVLSMAFSPDGALLVTSSYDGAVRLWDTATQETIATVADRSSGRAVAFSPDGALLAYTANKENSVRLWDTSTYEEIAVLTGHDDHGVTSVAFSPDGELLATSNIDGTVWLWDLMTHEQLVSLGSGQGDKWEDWEVDVAFSPDGELLASSSNDSMVRLWDTATHEEIAVLTGHDGSVRSVAFSPDGELLASGGEDSTVRLWDPARA